MFARDVTLEVPREGTAACTLHLPPTGSVRVAPTTDRGNPVTAGRFALAREGENFDLHIDNSGLRQPCQRIQAGDPLPTWDWVEVGMPLELRWWDENDRLLSNTPISGPSAAGESLEVVLEEYGASRTATARILDEKGRPAAHRILWMGISEDWLHGLAAQWTRILTVQTDAAGRLSVPLDPIGDLVSGQRLWPQWVFSDPPSGGAEHFVLTPRLARGGPEVLDLGDLTLQPMPLLVSGRVVDADGAPVECWVAARPGGHEGEFPEPDLNFKEQGFEANRSWSARSGPDGRYEIHGWFHSGAVELSTDAPAATVVDGHLAPRGATEHQIRLASCGAVQVDLRTMPGNPSEYVRMTLQVSQGRWLHARWTDKHTAFFAEVEHGVPLELKLDAAGGDPWDFWHGVVEVSAATTTFVSIPAIPMEVQHVLIPLHESGEPRFRINECQRSGIPCKALRSPGPGIPEYQEILILNPPGQTVDAVHVSRLPYVTSADEQTLVIPVGPGETRLDP
ncbi:MAG: hypothetical protein R3F33_06195 [Planctomycetota bacterium]